MFNTTYVLPESTSAMMVSGDCSQFANEVAKQIAEPLFMYTAVKTAEIFASYSLRVYNFTVDYLDHSKIPLDDLRAMHAHLKSELEQMTENEKDEMGPSLRSSLQFLKKTLDLPFEAAKPAIQAITDSIRTEKNEGLFPKIHKICQFGHEYFRGQVRGAFKACGISFIG